MAHLVPPSLRFKAKCSPNGCTDDCRGPGGALTPPLGEVFNRRGPDPGLCLKGRGARGAIPERLQSGHGGCESGWGAVTGGWKCGWGWCWAMRMPLG